MSVAASTEHHQVGDVGLVWSLGQAGSGFWPFKAKAKASRFGDIPTIKHDKKHLEVFHLNYSLAFKTLLSKRLSNSMNSPRLDRAVATRSPGAFRKCPRRAARRWCTSNPGARCCWGPRGSLTSGVTRSSFCLCLFCAFAFLLFFWAFAFLSCFGWSCSWFFFQTVGFMGFRASLKPLSWWLPKPKWSFQTIWKVR